MASLNKVFLMGNLTRDPELRYTPSGSPVCEFGMAVNRSYTSKDGEKHEDTCFVDVTAWGRTGTVISEYLTKGKPIFIEGRLNYDSWETPDGRRSKLRVVVENFQFIGGRGDQPRDDADRATAPRGEKPSRQGETPPGAPRNEPKPAPADDEKFDVSDDEIPF